MSRKFESSLFFCNLLTVAHCWTGVHDARVPAAAVWRSENPRLPGSDGAHPVSLHQSGCE